MSEAQVTVVNPGAFDKTSPLYQELWKFVVKSNVTPLFDSNNDVVVILTREQIKEALKDHYTAPFVNYHGIKMIQHRDNTVTAYFLNSAAMEHEIAEITGKFPMKIDLSNRATDPRWSDNAHPFGQMAE